MVGLNKSLITVERHLWSFVPFRLQLARFLSFWDWLAGWPARFHTRLAGSEKVRISLSATRKRVSRSFAISACYSRTTKVHMKEWLRKVLNQPV